MGTTEAIFATQYLINHFHPTLLVSLGISGALSRDVKLGDIVIAAEVDDYLHRAKAVDRPDTEDFTLALGGKSVQFSALSTQEALSVPDVDKIGYARWADNCERYRHQCLTGEQIGYLSEANLIADAPTLFHGVTACGPIVGASDAFVGFLVAHNRNYLSLDMESYGVGRAAKENGVDAVSIRGISDLSDSRKKDLDDEYKGSIRKLAIHSTATFVRLFLYEYRRSHSSSTNETPFTSTWPHSVLALERMSAGFLNAKQIRQETPAAEQMSVSTDSRAEEPTTHFFAERIGEILSDLDKTRMGANVIIRGAPGSGKSYLLRKVYRKLISMYSAGGDVRFPVYIDLKRYDTALLFSEASAEAALSQFRSDISALSNHVAELKEVQLVVLVDSVDYHAPHRDLLEDHLHSVVQSIEGASVVAAIGNDGRAEERIILWTSDRPKTIELHPWEVGSIEAMELIDLVVREQSGSRPVTVLDVCRAVERFDIRELDYLTVLRLVRSVGDLAFERSHSTSDFYQAICEEYVKRNSSRLSGTGLSQIAEIAHRAFIQLNPDPQKGEAAATIWKILHYHSTVQDFLVAYHVIDVLRSIGKDNLSKLDHLNYVFPERIDKLCKGIMWHNEKVERECVEGAVRLYSTFKKKRSKYMAAMTHASYMLGRVRNQDLRRRAKELLKTWKDEAERKEATIRGNDGHLSIGRRLLFLRTLYISLAYLGDQSTAEDYVQKLIVRSDWDDLNRGFHLEYYHDKAYLPDENQLAHEDNLEPFPKAFAALVHRINKALASGVNPPFQVEWFTLLSLAQHRHAANRLSEDTRSKLRDLIKRGAGVKMSGPLREYTDMIAKTLDRKYPVLRIVEELYGLKKVRRKGYSSKGKMDAESVPDHTFGAMLLGELFLPEHAGEDKELSRGYDKHEVLRMLLIHDLAEAFTGDRLPHEHSVEEEEGHFRYLEMAGTYRMLCGLQGVKERWETFEKSNDINARIARDLDKIENQLQLLIYVRSEGWQLDASDYEAWERDLSEAVKTSIGRAILNTVKESF
jgi:nucleoside phosphorylase/5'-deoxynucleotidase YfbR-like HD superfamily hydrolase